MKDQSYAATKTTEIHLTQHSPEYWRVTFDHPPLNIFGPETIPQLTEIVTALETDKHVKVVVFDSAVEGYFLTHYDFLAKLEDTTSLPPGPMGLQPVPDMLVRLSRAPVVSIASIRGRATGVGSELALACDMRFASREKAILSQFVWEVGAGMVPGGGPMARLPRLMRTRGRALEVLLGSDDVRGDLAERYGYVNRSFPGFRPRWIELDTAAPIASFDKQAISETKRFVDVASLPPDFDRAGVGCVPRLDHAAGRAETAPGLNGPRLSQTRRCRRALGVLRRASWALRAIAIASRRVPRCTARNVWINVTIWLVIGSGPAGQKGAINAAKLGKRAVVIERDVPRAKLSAPRANQHRRDCQPGADNCGPRDHLVRSQFSRNRVAELEGAANDPLSTSIACVNRQAESSSIPIHGKRIVDAFGA